MNQNEKSNFNFNKTIGQTSGLGLSILVPFNVALLLQSRNNMSYYGSYFKKYSAVTSVIGMVWLLSN